MTLHHRHGLAVLLGLALADPLHAAALCNHPEEVLFSCPLARPGKTVSLCGVAAGISYRFGAPGKIELELPGPGAAVAPTLVREDGPASDTKGVAFSRGEYRYVVTDFIGGRPVVQEQFVAVQRQGRPVALLKCSPRSRPTGDLRALFDRLEAQGWPVARE